jgi:hypothetical protein
MVSRNEILYSIFEVLRAHLADDEDIDVRQLESFIKDYRANFLKQRFDKNPFNIDSSCIQNTGVLSVIKEDSSSLLHTLPANLSGRYVMRTDKLVPTTVRRTGKVGTLLHIGSADKLDSSFSITDYETAIESGFGRFNRAEIFAFPYNGYIYFISKSDDFKTIYNVVIRGVFTDPEEVYNLNNTNLYTGNENYYTPRDLKRYIEASILKDKYGILINPPVDNVNDAVSNVEIQSK